MCALDKRMGGGGELVPGKQGGMEALHQLVLRTHYALRATHYVALRTTCKQAWSRAGGGAGIDRVVSEQAASSQATDRWGGGYQGGWGAPRGHQEGTKRGSDQPNSHQTLMMGGSLHKR